MWLFFDQRPLVDLRRYRAEIGLIYYISVRFNWWNGKWVNNRNSTNFNKSASDVWHRYVVVFLLRAATIAELLVDVACRFSRRMKLLQWDGLSHFREECRESLTHMGSCTSVGYDWGTLTSDVHFRSARPHFFPGCCLPSKLLARSSHAKL